MGKEILVFNAPGGAGGITNDAPVGAIPVTLDENGNLGDGDQAIRQTTFEGSNAWYFNNDGDGIETIVSQHNLIIASKDTLRFRTGIDEVDAASAQFQVATNYFNYNKDASISFTVGDRTAGSGGNVNFATGNGAGEGNNDAGVFRVVLGMATGTGISGQLVVDNLPTSNPGIAGALWSNLGALQVSAG